MFSKQPVSTTASWSLVEHPLDPYYMRRVRFECNDQSSSNLDYTTDGSICTDKISVPSTAQTIIGVDD